MSARRDPNSTRGLLERAIFKVIRGGGSAAVKRRKCGEAREFIVGAVLKQRPKLKQSTVQSMLSIVLTDKYGPPVTREKADGERLDPVAEPHNEDFAVIRRKGYEGWTATKSGIWVHLDHLTPGCQPCWRITVAETCFRLMCREEFVLAEGVSREVEVQIIAK